MRRTVHEDLESHSWLSDALQCRLRSLGAPAYTTRFDEALNFHEPGLAPVSRAGRGWHIRVDGTPAYGSRFKRTFGYYEGLAAVVAEEGWHHISPSGAPAYAARYSWCGNSYSERYAAVEPFYNGQARVERFDGAIEVIDESGRPIIELRPARRHS